MSYSSEPMTPRRNGKSHDAAGEVKENLSTLKSDAAKLASSIGDAAMAHVEEGKHRIEEVRHDAMDRAQTIFSLLENRVRTRPAATLGITLGAGLVLGMLLAGRRH